MVMQEVGDALVDARTLMRSYILRCYLSVVLVLGIFPQLYFRSSIFPRTLSVPYKLRDSRLRDPWVPYKKRGYQFP